MAQNDREPTSERPVNLEAEKLRMGQETGRIHNACDEPHHGAERPSRLLCVLLVEDNATNQMLAASLLKKAGHTVSTARNGSEALAALAARAFDVVLMDVEMPEMDGIEATARIRALERPGEHVPIVAMTAHDTKEDRERCLQSGMDSYLSKPLHSRELYQVLASFAPAPNVAEPVTAELQPPGCAQATHAAGARLKPAPPAAQCDVYDRSALLARLGGREDRMQAIIRTFLDESSNLMAQLADAIACGDVPGLKRPAHSLKGAAAIFGTSSVVEAVRRLEASAQAGDVTAVRGEYARLEQEFWKLRVALLAVLPPQPS